MKTLLLLLNLATLFSFSSALHAQFTASAVSNVTQVPPYSLDASVSESVVRPEMSKRERQRFQRSLVRRGDDLVRWEDELENREMALNGRSSRGRPALSRDPLPARLLNSEDLYTWETRLDRFETRLRSRDLLLQERELRVLRTRSLINRDNRINRLHDQRGLNNVNRCVESCCVPQN